MEQIDTIMSNARKYMNSLGFIESTSEDDGDYALYSMSRSNKDHTFIRLVFKLKGNHKHIEHFESIGWKQGKSYRSYNGCPCEWCSEFSTRNCTKGIFMATLEYPLNLPIDEVYNLIEIKDVCRHED